MKKFWLLIILITSFTLPSYAVSDYDDNDDESENVKLEFNEDDNNPNTGRKRTSSYISIDAFLNRDNNILTICYYGENNGEVYLYHNDILVNYSPELNIIFQLTTPGVYKVVIIEESWIATGYISI